MKIVPCDQGSDDWYKARMGKATASKFEKIITPTGDKSKSWETYAHEILAEEIVGHAIEGYKSDDMVEGQRREAESVAYYELVKMVDTTKIGFITNNAGTLGCSPDRLVGKDGMLEMKNPKHGTQVGYYLKDEKAAREYWPQLQGGLYVAERKWIDVMSYVPEMPEEIIHVERDKDYIARMQDLLEDFLAKLALKRKRLIELGHIKVVA